MLPKQPKRPPIVRRLVGGLIILESLAFGVAYLGWSRLNRSRDARQKVKESMPWALEMYYRFGEMISEKNKAIREADEKAWTAAANANN